MMLPCRKSPDFPKALKTKREALKLSRCSLANMANISRVSPRKYEDTNSKDFTIPSYGSWLAIKNTLETIEKMLEADKKENNITKAEPIVMFAVTPKYNHGDKRIIETIWQPIVKHRVIEKSRTQNYKVTALKSQVMKYEGFRIYAWVDSSKPGEVFKIFKDIELARRLYLRIKLIGLTVSRDWIE